MDAAALQPPSEHSDEGISLAWLKPLPPRRKPSILPVTETSILIGRATDCDLQLPNDERVSRHHAEVYGDGPTWRVRDLDSTNGTILNGESIVEATLQSGDRLRVGSTEIEFHHERPEPHPLLRWTRAAARPPGGEPIALQSPSMSIGRSPENHLVFRDNDSVSAHHATVSFSSGVWYVSDNDSRNGTRVNGDRIQRQQLSHGDEVCFGNLRFQFLLTLEPPRDAPSDDRKPDDELPPPATCSFLSVSEPRTIGSRGLPRKPPTFLGPRGSLRYRAVLGTVAFIVGFAAGTGWYLYVLRPPLSLGILTHARGLAGAGALTGIATLILTLLPQIVWRRARQLYYQLAVLGLKSRIRRRFRRADAAIADALDEHPDDVAVTADRIGLLLLRGDATQARELTDVLGREKTTRNAALANNCGVLFAQTHFSPEASMYFSSATEADRLSPAYHYNLGRALLSMQRPDAAEKSLRTALELDQTHFPARVALGRRHITVGDVASACAEWESALRLSPNAAGVLNNLGVAHHLAGRLEHSVRAFRRALRIDPGNAFARANLGMKYIFRGEDSLAIQELKKSARLRDDFVPIHINLATALFVYGEPADAEKHLRSAVSDRSLPADALYNLGTMAWLEGNYESAIDYMTRSVEKNPHDVAARVNLGCALFEGDLIQRASIRFENAVSMDPRNAAAQTDYGLALLHQGRTEAAIPYIERALTLNETHPVIRFNLAYARHILGRAEDAVALYEALVGDGHDFPEVYANIGLCRFYLGGNLDLSVRAFDAAVKQQPDLHTLPYTLGRVHCDREDFARAQRYLELSRRDEPANPDVHRDLGLVYYLTEQYDKSVREFIRAVQLSPHDAADQNNLALAYAKKGKHKEAIYHFQRALSFEPDDAVAMSNMGLSYYLSGNPEVAIQKWHEVSVLSPGYGAERGEVRHADFDDARLGFTPFDWKSRAFPLPPVGMGLKYQMLLSEDDDWELSLSQPELRQIQTLLRRVRHFEDVLRELTI